MPSTALIDWEGDRADRVDELLAIHERATGSGPGRRWGTEEFNRTLITALVAQFQAFARDLHTLAAEVFLDAVPSPEQRRAIRTLLTQGRRLDTRTPRRDHLGSDFARLGIELIPTLKDAHARSAARLDTLDGLVDLRNAIVHGNEQEVHQLRARGFAATKTAFRQHRRTIGALARTLDSVVAAELARMLSIARPW